MFQVNLSVTDSRQIELLCNCVLKNCKLKFIALFNLLFIKHLFLIGNTVGMETTRTNGYRYLCPSIFTVHIWPQEANVIISLKIHETEHGGRGCSFLLLRLAPHNCRHIRVGLLYCIICAFLW